MHKSRKELVGYKYLKEKQPDGQIIYHYDCVDHASIGRTITYLVKRIKTIEPCAAIVITGIEKLVFKRNPEVVREKYKRFYEAGNQTKGHFTPKTPRGLFKKLLRNNIKYKSTQKQLFKKFCVFSDFEYQRFVKSKNFKTTELCPKGSYNMRQNYYGQKIKLTELIEKI